MLIGENKIELSEGAYLKICLLLKMTGHGSSAKAPERTSSSNNFLHEIRDIKKTKGNWKIELHIKKGCPFQSIWKQAML